MKEIVNELIDYCVSFTVNYNEEIDAEILICTKLDFKVVKLINDYFVIVNNVEVKIKKNSATVKNIIKELDKVVGVYLDSIGNDK